MKSGYDQFFQKARKMKNKASKATSSHRTSLKERVSISSNQGEAVEDHLRKLLKKKKVQKRTSTSIPWKSVVALGGGVVTMMLALFYVDDVDKILTNLENTKVKVGFLNKSRAQEQSTEKKAKKNNSKVNKASKIQTVKKKDYSYLGRLAQRKEELDLRERELKKLEEEIQKQKQSIERKVVELGRIRKEISGKLQNKVQVDEGRVNKLVQFYSNMNAEKAAKIIDKLDEDLAVDILAKMKKKNAAEIMNLLPSDKARGLSEKFAGYRRALAGVK